MAAWSTDQIYSFVKFLLRKNQAGGISATDLFYAWNSEQSAYHQDLVGRWQNRNNTKTGQNTGLIQDEISISQLAPFIVPLTGVPIAAGNGSKPSDYIYALALRINGAKVYSVDHDMIWAVNEDVIDPPSIAANAYYYTEYLNYFSFLPNTVTVFDLDYVAETTDIVWGFTLDVNGREVYNPGSSVNPKWAKNTVIEITKRSLKSLAISFKDQDFEMFGQSTIQTGD